LAGSDARATDNAATAVAEAGQPDSELVVDFG
jgi:hypothetical protein